MDPSEERFLKHILQPLVESHTFIDSSKAIENQSIKSQNLQFLTLGLHSLIRRVEEGIVVLEYYGEWTSPDYSAEEIIALQQERIELMSKGLAMSDLKDLMNISEDRIDLYYARIQSLIYEEEFYGAGSVALLLLLLSPNDPAAWISFGIAEQLSGRVVRGAHAFVAAIELSQGALWPILYSAKALYQVGAPECAKELLELSIAASKEDLNQRDFRKSAYALYCSMP